MLSIAERHKYILDSLNKHGFVRITDVANELGVTKVTIRKDIKILESKGLLYKVHGSARPANPHVADLDVHVKDNINRDAKRRIAQRAAEMLGEQLEIIRRDAVVRVKPYGTITMGQRGCGELVDFAALAPQVVGFSDDGRGVQSAELMEEAMRRAAAVGKPIVAHCEVDELLRGGYIHDGVYCREHGHKGICSESEWRQVGRDIALAEKTGCRYHVCHVSTKESVELVRRARAKGLRVSCETAPHYLLLCDEDLQEEGRFKMNPPLRRRADREALVAGIQDGTIEVIATDHAPHTVAEKARGLAGSAMGIVGLETAFPLLYKYLVLKGVITLEKLVALMSANPRRIFALEGGVEEGDAADFTVLDLGAEYAVDPGTFLSKGRATPFAGWKVQGRAVLTVVGGKEVYDDNYESNR